MAQAIMIFCYLAGFVVQDNIDKLLKDLGADDVTVRENATQKLIEMWEDDKVRRQVEDLSKSAKDERLVKKIVSKKDSYNIEFSPCQKI